MDQNLERAHRIAAFVSTLFILILFGYILYKAYQVEKNERESKRKLAQRYDRVKLAEREDQAREDDMTTLIDHPVYEFEETRVEETSDLEELPAGCTYDQLKTLVKDNEWISSYRQTLEKSFELKLTKYSKLLNEAYLEEEKVVTRATPQGGPQVEIARIKTLVTSLEEVVEALRVRLGDLSDDVIRRDFTQLFHHPTFGLETLVGRLEFKNFIADRIYAFSRSPEIFFGTFQNTVVLGESGIGKTKLAQCLAYSYGKSGMLAHYKFKQITKKDLTNSFVNGSAAMAYNLLASMFEGVIYHDEAYNLSPTNVYGPGTRDHGDEATTEIVNFLDQYRGMQVYVASGYEKEMREGFLGANEGMARRFPHVITLTQFSASELTTILIRCIHERTQIVLDKTEGNILYTLISEALKKNPKAFPTQGGDMFNMAATISQVMIATPHLEWVPKSPRNLKLLQIGFRKFMKEKDSSKKAPKVPPTNDLLKVLSQMTKVQQ